MKPEWKTKWAAALRSGEYEQQQAGFLLLDGRYCCLGVLQNIAAPDARGWRNTRSFLTQGCARKVGLPFESDNAARKCGVQAKLGEMNDNGNSFAEIADWIEANL